MHDKLLLQHKHGALDARSEQTEPRSALESRLTSNIMRLSRRHWDCQKLWSRRTTPCSTGLETAAVRSMRLVCLQSHRWVGSSPGICLTVYDSCASILLVRMMRVNATAATPAAPLPNHALSHRHKAPQTAARNYHLALVAPQHLIHCAELGHADHHGCDGGPKGSRQRLWCGCGVI